MTKFEYKTEKFVAINATKMEKEVEVPTVITASEQLAATLPQLGEQGWDLVSVVPTEFFSLMAIFKRPRVETETTQGLRTRAIAASAKLADRAPLTALQVVSKPGGGVNFPQPLPPAQRDFPSRDFGTGFDANGSESD